MLFNPSWPQRLPQQLQDTTVAILVLLFLWALRRSALDCLISLLLMPSLWGTLKIVVLWRRATRFSAVWETTVPKIISRGYSQRKWSTFLVQLQLYKGFMIHYSFSGGVGGVGEPVPMMISLTHAQDISGLSESAGVKAFVISRWHDECTHTESIKMLPFNFHTWWTLWFIKLFLESWGIEEAYLVISREDHTCSFK